ncbi:MAG: imidazole glycerol phosphate synthase subunit HisF [Bacilli bacterium]
MLTKRIIPCLDVKEGRVVKGTQFLDLKDAGDPVELATYYNEQGADELVFLDISASHEGRETMKKVVEAVAVALNIPFTVGGGIRTVEDMRDLLRRGADKVSINTSAVLEPSLIQDGSKVFGSQCIVVAMDARFEQEFGEWRIYTHGGRNRTDWEVVAWAKHVEQLGAGEILLTSMNTDGEKSGFSVDLTRIVSEAVGIPVIASGGAGNSDHFYDVFTTGHADAGLAASIFHYKETTISAIKSDLREKGVCVR